MISRPSTPLGQEIVIDSKILWAPRKESGGIDPKKLDHPFHIMCPWKFRLTRDRMELKFIRLREKHEAKRKAINFYYDTIGSDSSSLA